ncbi:hypothetical protein, partial [Photobacterium halotolerans]|uniref:hypothetical protein n=1 Tax=Photobacterium halotolerans TaxID=265726 RepID=UPI00047FFC44
MIEQLQAVLNKHEEQEETIQRLQSRNLILADERDKLAQRVAELEVFQQKVSQVPALENKITRLMYNAEKLAGKLNLAEGELKIFRGEG